MKVNLFEMIKINISIFLYTVFTLNEKKTKAQSTKKKMLNKIFFSQHFLNLLFYFLSEKKYTHKLYSCITEYSGNEHQFIQSNHYVSVERMRCFLRMPKKKWTDKLHIFHWVHGIQHDMACECQAFPHFHDIWTQTSSKFFIMIQCIHFICICVCYDSWNVNSWELCISYISRFFHILFIFEINARTLSSTIVL